MDRPNVLLLITDQQTRSTMRAYGNERTRTPGMDALTDGGVAFERSYCASPVCSPGRASILTGVMPHGTGVNVNDVPLRDDVATVGERFREAGYDTAWAGKWNLPESFPVGTDATRGFDNLPWQRREYRDLGADMDEHIADEAVRFLAADRPDPFFLGISLYNPHDICFWIMDRDHDLLPAVPDDAELPELPRHFDTTAPEPEFVGWLRRRDAELPSPDGGLYGFTEIRWTDAWDERHWRRYLYLYDRLVELVDVQIARVLAALEEDSHADDTIVVLTSDHGEGTAAHRWVTKEMFYEEPVTVPLVVRWPGHIPAGRVDRSHLVSSVDIVPTLLDYAGIGDAADVQGVSLRPLIDDPTAAGREYLVTEMHPDAFRDDLKGRMVRTDRYKYMAFSAGSSGEMLFDLHGDPNESIDLAASDEHNGILEHHRQLLEAWMAETNDDFAIGSATLSGG